MHLACSNSNNSQYEYRESCRNEEKVYRISIILLHIILGYIDNQDEKTAPQLLITIFIIVLQIVIGCIEVCCSDCI
ncbi:hypothetical protein B566_EDAN013433 [Ephemera danica]|nr:hypothetical protein B566_EDAN013433 [Ephemera danica]